MRKVFLFSSWYPCRRIYASLPFFKIEFFIKLCRIEVFLVKQRFINEFRNKQMKMCTAEFSSSHMFGPNSAVKALPSQARVFFQTLSKFDNPWIRMHYHHYHRHNYHYHHVVTRSERKTLSGSAVISEEKGKNRRAG